MNAPKVDIIIPAYNQGHYLQSSVESALAQTWENIEVIIIDDGSTDNTAEVGQSFADPRVTYIYQENGGLSAARNTGLHHATGEFISFLDSDDLFLPQKIEALLNKLQANPEAGLAAGPALLIDENGQEIGKTYGNGIPDLDEEWLFGNRVHVGSILVKAEWLNQVEPFDESLRACEDWDMWMRLAIVGCKMVWSPDPVSKYRIHGQQMTKEAVRMKTAMLTVLEKIFDRDDLQPEWHEAAARAKAEALIKAAARGFLAGDVATAKSDLASSIEISPELKDRDANILLNKLLGWAYAPSSNDPFTYMSTVFENLPASLNIPSERKKLELGQLAVNLAFQNFAQANKPKTRKYVIEAAKIDPSQLMNKRLCSIFLQSLLPG
ncbi:MAG: glycosyltransferase [Anaerolineae bacterium]